MNKSDKSHDTGFRILEILKILLKEDINLINLMKKLNLNNDIANVYTNEAYIKYFNTFEAVGLNIKKIDDELSLNNALICIDLSQKEINILKKLIKSIPMLNNQVQEEKLKQFFYRLDKFVNYDLKKELQLISKTTNLENFQQNILDTLKKLMLEESLVRITYKKQNKEIETVDAGIRKIIEEKGFYYVICYNSSMSRSKKICLNLINSVEHLPKKVPNIEPKSNTVIYELYDRLARAYKLKDWENVEAFENNVLRISNTKEDFDTLLNRLLKYGENCKIIKPLKVVNDFLTLTEDVLENLKEE